MKILRLDLLAFGPFTGTCLDLSGGREGLHIVHGPNEAGKSAALRALKSLLYGIPARTADNFLHENRDLRIGGCVRGSDGSELAFRRRKGTKNTLLDADDKAIPEEILRVHLGGVDEESFSRMFGIGHEDLVRGGRELVAGGGEAGESLFAAAVGGAGLHHVLTNLENEADELFKPRASTRLINREVAQYKEATREAARSSLSSREWEEHRNALEEAQRERVEVARRVRTLSAERNRLERIVQALPAIAERAELLKKVEAMGEVCLLRESFGEERRNAAEELARAEKTRRRALGDKAAIEEKLAGLTVPEALLEQGEAVTELHQSYGSYRKTLRELPGMEGEMGQLLSDGRAHLKGLRPDLTPETAEAIRVTAAKRARIRELEGTEGPILRDRAAAAKSVATLGARIEAVQRELAELKEPPDPWEVRAAVERARKQGDPEGELIGARADRRATEEKLGVSLARIPLWTGDADRLAALPIPSATTLDRYEAALEGARTEIRRGEDRLRAARERMADLGRQVDALSRAGEVPTELSLFRARERRDLGWRIIRRSWLEGVEDVDEVAAFASDVTLVEVYEGAVKTADEIADRLRREADRVTKQATLLADLDATRASIEETEGELGRGRQREEILWKDWMALWSSAGIEPLTPREMRSWTQQVESLRQLLEAVRERRSAVERLEERIAASRAELRRALQHIGEPADGEMPLGALLERGEALVQRLDDIRRKREAKEEELEQLSAEHSRARDEHESADRELEKWQSRWGAAMGDLGLEAGASRSEVQEFLDKSQELFQKLDEAEKLRLRIEASRRETVQFADEARSLAGRVLPDLAEATVEQIIDQLHARLNKAREDAATRAQWLRQLRETEAEIQSAEEAIDGAKVRLDSMCREAGCASWEDLEAAERRSEEHRERNARIRQVEETLLAHSGGATLDDFLQTAASVDADILPERIRQLREEIEALETRLSSIEQAIGKEEGELERMDGRGEAADAAELAQGVLARVQEAVERYVRLRLASSILRREMERYRARNQGPLLDRSSQLFAHLTLGSFAALKTEYDEKDTPILVGLRPSGESVGVGGMSDGTRDQLYLALRLATLEKHLAANEPMPFILDDLLINFDDARSKATLEVLAELSAQTQVIFFTHHSHLIEIAEGAVDPGILQIHSIGW